MYDWPLALCEEGGLMFERILVCLDGSGAAEEILPYVIAEALTHRSKVVLLRVVSLPEITIPISIPGEPGTPMYTEGAVRRTRNEESKADDYLRRIAEPMREKGLDVQCVVLPGVAGETITNYTQDNGCTLIAIATHGHGGVRRLVLGSTADFVLHHSSVPILIVRPGNKQA
jgi:nucleotide-binding universal stress UspA family protein